MTATSLFSASFLAIVATYVLDYRIVYYLFDYYLFVYFFG
jgi:hypothetical protein